MLCVSSLTNGVNTDRTRVGRTVTFLIVQMQIPARTSAPDCFEQQRVLKIQPWCALRFWVFIFPLLFS